MMNRREAIRGAPALTAAAAFGPARPRAQGGGPPRPAPPPPPGAQTMMTRRDAIRGAAALPAAAAFGPARSRAQGGDYPRPDATIRYVVPFPAGGLTDQMARQIGQQLGERW